MLDNFDLADGTYESESRGKMFGIVRFLSERKIIRLVEIEAQSLPMFGARTYLGYFAIVAMMGCRTLQLLSVYHESDFLRHWRALLL